MRAIAVSVRRRPQRPRRLTPALDRQFTSASTDAPFLARRGANHAALTPLTFLRRTAAVFPERVAVVYDDWQALPDPGKPFAVPLDEGGAIGHSAVRDTSYPDQIYIQRFNHPMVYG
jgi:hypothetical protein